MNFYSDRYISRCIDIGILTEEPIRTYPLRPANLAVVLKAYAIQGKLPYTIDNHNFDLLEHHKLYLTEAGYQWLIEFFKQYSLSFLRTTFQFIFSNASEKDLADLNNYQGFSNFKGTVGVAPKAGTKQPAILERVYGKDGKLKQTFQFDNIVAARKELILLTRFYPLEQFTLYRVKKQKTKSGYVYYKDKIPLVLGENRRGMTNNLPHLRSDKE